MNRNRSTREVILRAELRKLRTELEALTVERDALKARLSRWGRPTNAKRAEAAALKARHPAFPKL